MFKWISVWNWEKVDQLTGNLSDARASFLPFICSLLSCWWPKIILSDSLSVWDFVAWCPHFEANKEVTQRQSGYKNYKSQEAAHVKGASVWFWWQVKQDLLRVTAIENIHTCLQPLFQTLVGPVSLGALQIVQKIYSNLKAEIKIPSWQNKS